MTEEPSIPVAPDTTGNAPVAEYRDRVLVVDDEPAQRMLSRIQLKKLGCDATVVTCGEEAVALFESASAEGQPSPFDLVLMDMVMPGLDGIATCKIILGMYPTQSMMIVSGYPPGARASEAAQLGLAWLTKPYTFAELAQSIQIALKKYGAGQS